ncbi:MAG: hypothetical protein ABI824_11000 [Acidobacteriota bacterium]
MPTRAALHALVDRFPDTEIGNAERFLALLAQEPIGPEFAESIRRGLAQAESDQTVVCRDYSQMAEKLLSKGYGLRFPFTLEAQAQLRAIDRAAALRIFGGN